MSLHADTVTLHSSIATLTPDLPSSRSMGRCETFLLNLSPAYWSITMGTGITSILLYHLPYNAASLRIIAQTIFVLNITLFLLLGIGNIIRYTRWKVWDAVVKSPAGLFLGCLPMGLATIINMMAYVCAPWGYAWAKFALGLWWIDAVISLSIALGMIFALFTRQNHTPESISATFLLPIVAPIVAAASGAVVANALLPYNTDLASSTIVTSYILWGTGVPLAFAIITIWLYRTILFGLPPTPALCSIWLPLGPCGQGAFGIMSLGRVSLSLSNSGTHLFASVQGVGMVLYGGGMVLGLIMWGLGLCFYTLGMMSIIREIIRDKSFLGKKSWNMGFWALTFPIGVFATATTTLAAELDSTAFRVIGTFLSLQVTLHWMYVSVMTIWKCFDGSIGEAIELKGFEGEVPLRWAKRVPVDVEKGLGD